MRGHGRSTNPDTGKIFLHATAANDLVALIEKLSLKKVKAIGHSSGGITILYAATKQPDFLGNCSNKCTNVLQRASS